MLANILIDEDDATKKCFYRWMLRIQEIDCLRKEEYLNKVGLKITLIHTMRKIQSIYLGHMGGITYSGSDEKSESRIRIQVMFLTLGDV